MRKSMAVLLTACIVIGALGSSRAVHAQETTPLGITAGVEFWKTTLVEQLTRLGDQIQVPVYPSRVDQNPVDICLAAREEARAQGRDTLIIDTAGRLHIDEKLMDELRRIREAIAPSCA